jgi:hypothetical protein
MTTSEKHKAVRTNTMLWIAAMLLPGLFYVTMGAARFPWPVLVPLLLLGPMIASNQMLARAIGKPSDESPGEPRSGN